MKSSRYYQNRLQIVARISTISLYFSGASFVKDKYDTTLILLLINLLAGYFMSRFRFCRLEAIVEEVKIGLNKELRRAKFYHNCAQISGRGKDLFVFFLGILLGKGYVGFSVILLLTQLVNGTISTELLYKRQQASLGERLNGSLNGD